MMTRYFSRGIESFCVSSKRTCKLIIPTYLTAAFLGWDGDLEWAYMVTTGPFKGTISESEPSQWPIRVKDPNRSEPDFLRRELGDIITKHTNPNGLIAFPDPPPYLPTSVQVENLLKLSTFKEFHQEIENLHNKVHWWVAGCMLQRTSPNDPVFWLHHANIDRLWAMWQCNRKPGYVPSEDGYGVALDQPMKFQYENEKPPWDESESTTPADVLNHHRMGYCYPTDCWPDAVAYASDQTLPHGIIATAPRGKKGKRSSK